MLKLIVKLLLLTFLLPCAVYSAPRLSSPQRDPIPSLKAVSEALEALRHESSNHETELKMVEERLNNHDNLIETLQQLLQNNSQMHKEMVKNSGDLWKRS